MGLEIEAAPALPVLQVLVAMLLALVLVLVLEVEVGSIEDQDLP